MLINMTASIEEINKSLDYATNFFSGDTNKMYDETKSIEKQIAELLEAHQAKTGTSIVRIGIAWTSLSIATKEQKVRAVNIDAQTDIL